MGWLMRDYSDYADHPRFGKAPRFTGRNPSPLLPWVKLHWYTPGATDTWREVLARLFGRGRPTWRMEDTRRVRWTAIRADGSRQTHWLSSFTHYYDLDKICCDCGRRFIFFAKEQKYWYEELQLPMEADAQRCCACRKRLREHRRVAQRYEQLLKIENRSDEETLELADCCLTLTEAGIFKQRKMTERVRMFLNQVSVAGRSDGRHAELKSRVQALEAGDATY